MSCEHSLPLIDMLEDIVIAKIMRPLRICLFILFLIAPLSGYAQMDYDNGSEVFTFHKGGIPVLLYHDAECTNPGAIILPFYQEYMYIMGDMAGAIVHIHRDRELSFELEADGMYLYIKKGDVAINTRNYDGACGLRGGNDSRMAPTGNNLRQPFHAVLLMGCR